MPTLQSLMDEILEVKDLLAKQNKYRFAEQYIDTDELCQLLKISKRTIQYWRNSCTLPYAQLGKKVYYRLSDIERLFTISFDKTKYVKRRPSKRNPIKHNPKSKGWTITI